MTVKWNQVFGAFPPGDLIRDELKDTRLDAEATCREDGPSAPDRGANYYGKEKHHGRDCVAATAGVRCVGDHVVGLGIRRQLRKVYDKQKAAKRAKKKAAAGPAIGLETAASRPALPKSSGATKDKVVAKSVLKIRAPR